MKCIGIDVSKLLRQLKKQLCMLLNLQESFQALPKIDITASKALKKEYCLR